MNKIFAAYTKAYYSPSAISSVYTWELGNNLEDGFCTVILIKNVVTSQKGVDQGIWDSSNFVTATFSREGGELKVELKLTTTVMLQMSAVHLHCGALNLSGSLTKQVTTL